MPHNRFDPPRPNLPPEEPFWLVLLVLMGAVIIALAAADHWGCLG